MKNSIVALAAVVAAAIISSAAYAQVPRGSYLQSCTNVQFDGYMLQALCADASGGARPSRIAVDQCAGGIANSNGRLVCAGGGRSQRQYGRDSGYGRPSAPEYGGGRGGRLPPGSWQASCSNPNMQGSTLIAVCATAGGGARQTAVDVRGCRGVANRNGRLVCE